jgi:iron complex outermembrane receptor protein
VIVTIARRLCSFLFILALAWMPASIQAQEPGDLGSLSVDDLMNVEVTSVSRRGQKVSETAAAVFVITQDDIRRSGATSIPEILRIVPGLDVARINGNVWAITARGGNGQFANKLLVLIDGRSVYSPLFSGVYWDDQDTLLEDVERIEVIRGPGGTLWGANAVNGIINIITKHSIDTQGALLSAGGGVVEGSLAAGRFGGSIGQHGHYRAYGKWFDRPPSVASADVASDAWSSGRAGFRADWTSRHGDAFTAQGDIYRGTVATIGVVVDPDNPYGDRIASTRVESQSLQFRWTATQSSRSETTLQAFVDDTTRADTGMVVGGRTFDVDFQHHWTFHRRNDVVWGAQYRSSADHVAGSGIAFVGNPSAAGMASLFVQDEIEVGRRVHVTVGTKLQYDAVSDLQFQPTLRVLVKASERQSLWAAATSAIRTPSEAELYGRITVDAVPLGGGNTALVVFTGNPLQKPERIEAYEIGYRWQATPSIALDATAFHTRMRDLRGATTKPPVLDSSRRVIIPLAINNSKTGHANGAELYLTDAVTANWSLALGYSFFQMTEVNDQDVRDVDSTPRHQLQLRSFVQLPHRLELDSTAYYVGRIGQDVRAYVRLDAQMTWHAGRQWALSISGQNLLQAEHTEFVGSMYEKELATPIQRSVTGKVTWRF